MTKIITEISKVLIIASVLLIYVSAIGQGAKDIILKLRESYQNHQRLQLIIKYQLIEDLKVLDSVSGVYFKSGNRQYYSVFGQECLLTDEISLIIDHDQKVMIKSDPVNFFPGIWLPEADSLINQFSEAIILKESPHRVKIQFKIHENRSQEIRALSMSINKDTYMCDSVLIFYKRFPDGFINKTHTKKLPYVLLTMNPVADALSQDIEKTNISAYLKPPDFLLPAERFQHYHFVNYSTTKQKIKNN